MNIDTNQEENGQKRKDFFLKSVILSCYQKKE